MNFDSLRLSKNSSPLTAETHRLLTMDKGQLPPPYPGPVQINFPNQPQQVFFQAQPAPIIISNQQPIPNFVQAAPAPAPAPVGYT
ncbi:hypothetical protein F2P79_007883 [Pimephales promelas]|nr:hypothetical protein F2P79_007883 [Pimephales promelas]